MTRFRILALITALMLCSGGCSVQRLARQQLTRTTLDLVEVYDRESDIDFARQALPASMKMLEGAISADPDNQKLLCAALRSYARYAWGFSELDIEQARLSGDTAAESRATAQATIFYRRAISYGHRILKSCNPLLTSDSISNVNDLRVALQHIDRSRAEALYWTAFASGNLLRLEHVYSRLPAELTRVQLMMQRVTELDDGFLSGRAHAFLGAIYASLPPMLGQDLSLAEQHFEVAERLASEHYLPVSFARVQYLVRRTATLQRYRQALLEIARETRDANPSWALDNAVIRFRAEVCLREAVE